MGGSNQQRGARSSSATETARSGGGHREPRARPPRGPLPAVDGHPPRTHLRASSATEGRGTDSTPRALLSVICRHPQAGRRAVLAAKRVPPVASSQQQPRRGGRRSPGCPHGSYCLSRQNAVTIKLRPSIARFVRTARKGVTTRGQRRPRGLKPVACPCPRATAEARPLLSSEVNEDTPWL